MGENGHLLFVWTANGYELREAEGDPPEVGTKVQPDGETAYFISKIGPSPRPGDTRSCAYLQPVP